MNRDNANDGDAIWARIRKTVTPLKNRKAFHTPSLPQIPESGPVHNQPAHMPGRAPARTRRTSAPVVRVRDRRVRNGSLSLEGRIDLHGLTHDAAYDCLLHELQALQRRGARAILVITGRGKADQGVLRTSMERWLNGSAFRVLVWGYAQAHARHGGKGAWYVFLRRL